MSPDRTGVVIHNPVAGRGRGATAVAAARTRLGDDWLWIATQSAGQAQELALRACGEGSPVVAALGGDGTVADVARGIIESGAPAALGVLPAGTGNDFARNLGIPLDLASACDILAGDRRRRIDIGTINAIPFINNAGTGFDARVMEIMNTSIRFIRGKPAFLLAVARLFPSFQAFRLTLRNEDEPEETISAMMVSVLNGSVYGAGMKACPDGRMDDGELDVLIITEMPKLRLLGVVRKVMQGTHVGHPAVRLFRTRRLLLQSDPAQPLNIDGDVRGRTPADIRVVPAMLDVVVP